MKSIVLFMAYYGKLPTYFDIWLKTVEYNNTIDFIFISDLMEGKVLPQNVRVFPYSFDEFKIIIQDQFDFKISLNNYGRISQFRPAFGDIFNNEISSYDYWGYVECDLLLGNIRKFLKDSILSDNDRVFRLGHLQLFKNNEKMRYLYKQNAKSALNYKFAYTHDILFFEEGIGINNLCIAKGCKTFEGNVYADIKWTELPFYKITDVEETGPMIFKFCDGELSGYYIKNSTIIKEEYIYVHFQKRVLEVNTTSHRRYIILPNIIVSDKEVNKELFVEMNNNLVDKTDEYKCSMLKRLKNDKRKRYMKIDWWLMLIQRMKVKIHGGMDL